MSGTKSFETAKKEVLAAINKQQPDNGMEMMWLNSKKAAAEALTEETMKAELAKPATSDPTATREVAEQISKAMKTGGRRRKSRKATRRRITRRRR